MPFGLPALGFWISCIVTIRSWSLVLPLTPHAFCTSLSICTVRKLLAWFTVAITASGLVVQVALGLVGLYLRLGKARLVTSRSTLGLVDCPTAHAMACLTVVASPVTILPSLPFRLIRLAPLLLQNPVHDCPIILTDRQTSSRLSQVWVLHYLQPSCPTAWNNVMTGATVLLWLSMLTHMSHRLPLSRQSYIQPRRPDRPSLIKPFFFPRTSCGRVCVPPPYVSGKCFPYMSGVYYLRWQVRLIFPMDSGCLIFPIKRWSWRLFQIENFFTPYPTMHASSYTLTSNTWVKK